MIWRSDRAVSGSELAAEVQGWSASADKRREGATEQRNGFPGQKVVGGRRSDLAAPSRWSGI